MDVPASFSSVPLNMFPRSHLLCTAVWCQPQGSNIRRRIFKGFEFQTRLRICFCNTWVRIDKASCKNFLLGPIKAHCSCFTFDLQHEWKKPHPRHQGRASSNHTRHFFCLPLWNVDQNFNMTSSSYLKFWKDFNHLWRQCSSFTPYLHQHWFTLFSIVKCFERTCLKSINLPLM